MLVEYDVKNNFLFIISLLTAVSSFAAINVDLVFDSNDLVNGSGSFSISGSADSSFGFPSLWSSSSTNGSPANLLTPVGFVTITADSVTNAPQITYDGSVEGGAFLNKFLDFTNLGGASDPENAFIIDGIDSSSPSGTLLVIGNGTTDALTGTFVTASNNLGTFSIAALNGAAIGDSASNTPNVFITASIIPEPGHYAALFGLLAACTLLWRRRAKR